MVVVLIGISFFTFLLTYISPGDPVRNMLSATGVMPTEELIRDLRDVDSLVMVDPVMGDNGVK